MSDHCALVVGANGAIGGALVSALAMSQDYKQVYGVSRRAIDGPEPGVTYTDVDEYSDEKISAFCQHLNAEGVSLSTVVIAIGVLHDRENRVNPEKRLEDIHAQALTEYFHTNSVIPALWLKHLLPLMDERGARIVCVSARVGSISDNRLGGWYGYRASKAALNMLIKTAQVEYKRRSPNTVLVAYHPGTVDSKLSAPFQRNLPQGQLIDANTSASSLLRQLADMVPEQGPYYVDWKGQSVDW